MSVPSPLFAAVFCPGTILTINTAGQFLGWQPHIRGIATCGGFLPNGQIEATRVIVYEGQMPVRMKPARIVKPGGAAH